MAALGRTSSQKVIKICIVRKKVGSSIKKEFDERLSAVSAQDKLEELKVAYLGKKGELTSILKGMGQLSPEERPVVGQMVNAVRAEMEAKISEKTEQLKAEAIAKKLAEEKVDVTMPGKTKRAGSLHPINQISDEMKDLFIGMGYEIADGPEIEFDYYNFEALNLPEGHPARDTQDTFYITEKMLLRTQTSSVQIHVMENKKPPISEQFG